MYLYEGIEKAEKKLRAVLLGCGEQAVNMIHNAISYLDEIEVVAVCDKNKERADFAARRLGLSRSYQDAGRMLDEVDADAAFIITLQGSRRLWPGSVLRRGFMCIRKSRLAPSCPIC